MVSSAPFPRPPLGSRLSKRTGLMRQCKMQHCRPRECHGARPNPFRSHLAPYCLWGWARGRVPQPAGLSKHRVAAPCSARGAAEGWRLVRGWDRRCKCSGRRRRRFRVQAGEVCRRLCLCCRRYPSRHRRLRFSSSSSSNIMHKVAALCSAGGGVEG